MFFYEFCEISKNTFIIEHLRWLLLSISTNMINTISTNVTSTASTNFDDKKVRYKIDCYILTTILIICYHYAKQKRNVALTK